MKLLLIENAPGQAFELEDRLVEAGHEVLSCNDSDGGPCRSVGEPSACPLEDHVDVAILARHERSEPTLNEAGILCARRRHVPVVRLGSPEAEVQLTEPGELENAVWQATRRVERQFVEVIEHALADRDAVVTVDRTLHRLAVTVRVPARSGVDEGPGAIADRARAAARAFDPWFGTIDVAVVVTPGD